RQSVLPSQSLSAPSWQMPSGAPAQPPLPEQTQALAEQSCPYGPHERALQSGSAQSVAPSPSLSSPSPQPVSVFAPPSHAPAPQQSRSAQSVSPSPSLSTPPVQRVSTLRLPPHAQP